jgi:hypothetical protein
MNKVCIGIPIHAEPERLLATTASVRASTGGDFQLVLLPDGPDNATAGALASRREIPQLATLEPRGGGACFNRLAQFTLRRQRDEARLCWNFDTLLLGNEQERPLPTNSTYKQTEFDQYVIAGCIFFYATTNDYIVSSQDQHRKIVPVQDVHE